MNKYYQYKEAPFLTLTTERKSPYQVVAENVEKAIQTSVECGENPTYQARDILPMDMFKIVRTSPMPLSESQKKSLLLEVMESDWIESLLSRLENNTSNQMIEVPEEEATEVLENEEITLRVYLTNLEGWIENL